MFNKYVCHIVNYLFFCIDILFDLQNSIWQVFVLLLILEPYVFATFFSKLRETARMGLFYYP